MSRLYVGNLSYETTNEDLEKWFKEVAEVENADVIKDRDSGRSKGFGFVMLKSEEDVEKVISEMNEKEFGGRALRVSLANSRDSNRDSGSARYSKYSSRDDRDSDRPYQRRERGGGGGGDGCFNCGDSGHFSRECPKGRGGGRGGGRGRGGDRGGRGGRSGGRSGGDGCFNCGESGHFSRECPNGRRDGGRDRGDRGDREDRGDRRGY